MEVAISRGQTEGGARNPSTDPRHEPGQSAVGRASDPRRTPQARHRHWSNLGRQIHGNAPETPIPRVEDVPRNHADGIVSMDLFVVPTLSFRLLYGLLILWHGRRQILWLGVTAHPSAEWDARQLTEAGGWEWNPSYIVRDRDGVYGEVFTRRLPAMGIRDRPTAPHSPWQTYGTADWLDHAVVFGEWHLRHLLISLCSIIMARGHISLNSRGQTYSV
jgi:hypothetical protein